MSGQLEILLVEDDEEDYLLAEHLVAQIDRPRHRLTWVRDRAGALDAVRNSQFDACLVDYRLGADDGIEVVRDLTSNGHSMPVIVLTGHDNHDVDVEAAQAGAADYLVKGEVSPALLERTLRYAIRRHADLQTLRETEEGLRQAQRMESVGRLAGGVAHDFNNMMCVVIGFCELVLARLEADHPQRKAIEEVRRAGERATALTTQLLAFSRRQVLQPTVLDLNDVVVNLEELLRRLVGEDIDLVTRLDPSLGRVEADAGQLEQAIVNLAVNARDAMPVGGKLTIETSNITLDDDHASLSLDVRPGPYILLAVSDNGTGMDEETGRQIFEPFFTTKEEGKGTGLGLSTVFGVIKQSGGDIGVYSELGHGTTFKIYLPQTNARAEVKRPSPVDNRRRRGSETILLVEDEELVRKLERTVLEESGYTVLEAVNPRDAVALAQHHAGPIDLLLTDVVMPQMGGRELADRVASERPHVKILYTSGYASDAIVHHGVLEQGIAFLAKPLTPQSLTSKVREVLDAPNGGPARPH